MALRISVWNSKELQAALSALNVLDRDTLGHIRRETKAMAQSEWKEAVAATADTRLEQRVLASTARATASNQNVTLKSAHIGRSLSGGAKPSEIYHAVEFGASQSKVETYQRRSKNGGTHQVKRHTTRQLRPRNRKGYAVYPAAAQIIPRLASLWVQTITRGIHEAFEGR